MPGSTQKKMRGAIGMLSRFNQGGYGQERGDSYSKCVTSMLICVHTCKRAFRDVVCGRVWTLKFPLIQLIPESLGGAHGCGG